MGKNPRGKEIGKGISQRKDGLYCARFVNKRGKRQERCFSALPEARNWLDDAKHTDKYGNAFTPSIMTVDIVLGIWLPTPAGTARNDISIISNLCQIASARIKNERQRKQRYNEPAPQQ
ncbi:hypothetical protein AALA80_09065 [Oscillospiraceae bacterium 50-60]